MQSPATEWMLAIGHLAVLDYLRSRGEADDDTISEVTRSAVDRLPYGPQLLAVALAGLGGAYWRHIVKPLRGRA